MIDTSDTEISTFFKGTFHYSFTYVFEQEMNEGSSNDIAVPSYEFNFGLTAIIHNE
jgi:hypothetical protein